MILRPSASRSALLLQCSWPFGRELAPEATNPIRDEAASYGLDFHAAMDGKKSRLGKKIGRGVLAHAREATKVLEAWLKREGWAGARSRQETSFAYNPVTGEGRLCKSPDEKTHIYPDQKPDEIAGTADRVLERARGGLEILVIDYKTGADDEGSYARPSKLPQLLTLGLAAAAARVKGTGRPTSVRVRQAVLHAPRDVSPVLYADPPVATRAEHRAALETALARIGDGTMRPGPECRYCPARDVCPTRGVTLLDRADGLLGGLAVRQSETLQAGDATGGAVESWDDRLGRLYAMTKLAEDTAKEIRKRLAEERRKGHLPVVPVEDWVPASIRGKVLDFRKRTFRNLSMSAMVRQIGKKAADREFARLEKLGAIETVEREELFPTDD